MAARARGVWAEPPIRRGERLWRDRCSLTAHIFLYFGIRGHETKGTGHTTRGFKGKVAAANLSLVTERRAYGLAPMV
eukprot:1315232-Prymnesium_polylepis.1